MNGYGKINKIIIIIIIAAFEYGANLQSYGSSSSTINNYKFYSMKHCGVGNGIVMVMTMPSSFQLYRAAGDRADFLLKVILVKK